MADHVGNLGRSLVLVGVWDGKALEDNFKNTADKVNKAAGAMAEKTGGLVNKKMGKAMSAFNEKTEKGRQLMTTFGGALGGAAGNATYYAGTLSYVIGQFKIWEFGVMAVVGGLAIMGKALYDLATDKMQKIHAATDDYRKKTEKLTEAVDALYKAEYNRYHGIDRIAALKQSVEFEMWWNQERLKNLIELKKKEYEYWAVKGGAMFSEAVAFKIAGKAAQEFDQDIASVNRNIKEAEEALKRLGKAAEFKATSDARDKKGGKGKKDEDPYMLSADSMDAHVAAIDKYYRDLEKKMVGSLALAEQIERDYLSRSLKMWEENAERKERILQGQLDRQMDYLDKELEKEKRNKEAQNNLMLDGIAIYEEMGTLLASSEEAATFIKISAIMLEAGYRASMEIAKGVAAIETPWIAAAHFSAAALFGAVAAGQVAETVSASRGSQASSGDRSSMQGDSNPWGSEKKETTIIVQLGGREVGRAMYDEIEGYKDDVNPNRKHGVVGYG